MREGVVIFTGALAKHLAKVEVYYPTHLLRIGTSKLFSLSLTYVFWNRMI